jgi:hypothetical protein
MSASNSMGTQQTMAMLEVDDIQHILLTVRRP